MKRARKLLVMMLSVLMILCFPLPVSAASGNGHSADPDATGLITSYELSCTAGSKRILINANVYASDVMAKIGFKNITIEQSSTGTGSWSTYFQPSDSDGFRCNVPLAEQFLNCSSGRILLPGDIDQLCQGIRLVLPVKPEHHNDLKRGLCLFQLNGHMTFERMMPMIVKRL